MRAATKTLRHSRDWAERERRAPAALSSLFSVTLDVAAHNPLTDGRYLSLVSTVHNVWWVAPGLRSFYKWQGVRIFSCTLHVFLSVSQAAALFIFCLKLLSVSPLSLSCVWLRDPDVGGDKDSRSRSRSDQWGLVTSRTEGNIISASRPAGARAAGDKENQAPDDFITSAASDWGCDLLRVRDDNRETLAWYQMSLSPLSVAAPRRVSQSGRGLRFKDHFFEFFRLCKKFSLFALLVASTSELY